MKTEQDSQVNFDDAVTELAKAGAQAALELSEKTS
jgi:hypothetical protein